MGYWANSLMGFVQLLGSKLGITGHGKEIEYLVPDIMAIMKMCQQLTIFKSSHCRPSLAKLLKLSFSILLTIDD